MESNALVSTRRNHHSSCCQRERVVVQRKSSWKHQTHTHVCVCVYVRYVHTYACAEAMCWMEARELPSVLILTFPLCLRHIHYCVSQPAASSLLESLLSGFPTFTCCVQLLQGFWWSKPRTSDSGGKRLLVGYLPSPCKTFNRSYWGKDLNWKENHWREVNLTFCSESMASVSPFLTPPHLEMFYIHVYIKKLSISVGFFIALVPWEVSSGSLFLLVSQ